MTAYEMRMSDWSSDVCSSDLIGIAAHNAPTTVRESPIVRTPFARNSLAVALELALPCALVACKQPAANPDTAAAAAATAATSDQQSETARLNARCAAKYEEHLQFGPSQLPILGLRARHATIDDITKDDITNTSAQ